jgi:hypothetical protein
MNVKQTAEKTAKEVFNMVNIKKIICIMIVLLTIISIGKAFALEKEPEIDWNGDTVTVTNPNSKPKKGEAEDKGTLTDIQICIVYWDGEGKRREFTSKSFTLLPGKSKDIPAPGKVITASATTCTVLFGN